MADAWALAARAPQEFRIPSDPNGKPYPPSVKNFLNG
jgi:hypothetical protein